MTSDPGALERHFAELLRTFLAHDVEFLLVGGFGVAPLRIDILTRIDGVAFDRAWKGRATADFDGLRFPVIGRAELIANKKASGRDKDLLDVKNLRASESRSRGARTRPNGSPRGPRRKR